MREICRFILEWGKKRSARKERKSKKSRVEEDKNSVAKNIKDKLKSSCVHHHTKDKKWREEQSLSQFYH